MLMRVVSDSLADGIITITTDIWREQRLAKRHNNLASTDKLDDRVIRKE